MLSFSLASITMIGLAAGAAANPIHPDADPYLVRTLPTGGADVGGIAWDSIALWSVDQTGVLRRIDRETGAVLQSSATGLSTHNGLVADNAIDYWMTFDPGGNTQFAYVSPAGGVGGATLTPTSGARDMTIQGGNFWYADFDEGKIVKMDGTGVLISEFASPFGIGAQGLEWDGKHLLHTKHDGTELLFIDPVTRLTMGSMDLAPLGVKAGGGLAWDGEYLYIADFDQIYVVGFNPPPVPVDGIPFLVATHELPGFGMSGVAVYKRTVRITNDSGYVYTIDPETGGLNGPNVVGFPTHNGLGSVEDDLWMSFDPGGNTRFVRVIQNGAPGVGTAMDTPTSGARDMTGRNGNLWYADFDEGKIVEMTPAGALVSQFDSPFGFGAQGLEWDGQHLLHTAHDGDTIHLIDPDTQSTVSTIDLSSLGIDIAGGIAWDGRNLYAADGDRLYVIGFFDPGKASLAQFADDFEDSVFTERNWTQGVENNGDDDRWIVSAAGAFVIDNKTTDGLGVPIGSGAFANRLGCGALQEGPQAGVTQYSKNGLLMEYRMRVIETSDDPSAYGAFVLADPSHPTIYPGLIAMITGDGFGGHTMILIRFNGLLAPGDPFILLGAKPLPSSFDDAEWNDYRIVVQDSTIYYSVNVTNALSLPLPLLEDGSPIIKGGAGFAVDPKYIVEYDDFLIIGEQVCETNTPSGEDVEVELTQGVTMSFDDVTTEGTTTVVRSQDPPAPVPDSLQVSFLGEYYDISTTAEFEGSVLLTFDYDGSSLTEAEESTLSVLHYNETIEDWEDITVRPVDTVNDTIQALTDGFSTFGIALPNLSATFLTPLGEGTTSTSPAGPFKLKRTVPIKFQLINGAGVPVPDDVAGALDPQLHILLERELDAGVPVDPGDNAGDSGSSFRYDADDDLFIYNLKTKGDAWNADRVYRVEVLIGGLVNGTAFFALK